MKIHPYPGYEFHTNFSEYMEAASSDKERSELSSKMMHYLTDYSLPEGMTMEDIQIPGPEDGVELTLRIYRPAGIPEPSPVIMEVHGGGWFSGDLDIDNSRAIFLAEHTPCVVVGVEYRLASDKIHFPQPLIDCLTAWNYIQTFADELRIDPKRMGMHGTSAGASLIAGLSLYIRDHGMHAPVLTALNCPLLTDHRMNSAIQLGFGPGAEPAGYTKDAERIYYPEMDGRTPSYYAFPLYCQDLSQLNPHLVIAAEYDSLRDHGIEYAVRLMAAEVPCELTVAPRVAHGFCVVDEPYTEYVQMGVCQSFRREFGLL